jgi:hypothetical protein
MVPLDRPSIVNEELSVLKNKIFPLGFSEEAQSFKSFLI